ncbi:hypothetical protein [Streptomyces radiopugnans]
MDAIRIRRTRRAEGCGMDGYVKWAGRVAATNGAKAARRAARR